MFHRRILNDIEFKTGINSQFRMFRNADKLNHTVYLVSDFMVPMRGVMTPTKMYCSFKTWDNFFEKYYPKYFDSWHMYELVREGHKCRVYFDLDWDPKKMSVYNVLKHFRTFLNKSFGIKPNEMALMDASTETKGSIHVVLPGYYVENNELLKPLMKKKLKKYGKALIDVVDISVYSKNRNMRLPYSTKIGDPMSRMLKPVLPATMEDLLITKLTGKEKKLKP